MPIETVTIQGSERTNFAPSVNVNGAVLTISGSGSMDGKVVSLPSTTYTLKPNPVTQVASGHLVVDVGGNVSLLVDEVMQDGVDQSFTFEPSFGLNLMHTIFRVRIPANATSFDGLKITVKQIVIAVKKIPKGPQARPKTPPKSNIPPMPTRRVQRPQAKKGN